MITSIEEAALTRLNNRITGLRTGSRKDAAATGVTPDVEVACLEWGFQRVAKGQWKQTATISVLLTIKSVKSEEARRKGVNALVASVTQLLLEQKLGLDITPLHPVSGREVTNEDDYTEGKIKYLLQFSTSFVIERLDEEEVEDLLGIAAEYLLQPGDDVLDAADDLAPPA